MKKNIKFVALLLVACMAFMFAGCDLFGQNTAMYYNQNVITVKYDGESKIEISRREFLTAYNNYGQNLINSYNYTEEKAKEATVDALVKRKILLEEAKRVAKTTEGASVELTQIEKRELRYQTYEALLSNARDYEDTIRDAWDMPKEDSMKEDVSEESIVYKKYDKKARPVYDKESKEFKIELIDDQNTVNRGAEYDSLENVYNKFIAETKNNQKDAFAREEYRRYLASLQSSQKVLGTNLTEKELIEKEIKRIYDNLEENEYITKYQEYKQENGGFSTITVKQVLEKYKSMITVANFKYENDLDTFASDMLKKRENVDYLVNDDYFYVAHILIKFSDEQQALYNEYKEKNEAGHMSDIVFEQETAKLYSQIMASERDLDTGEVIKEDYKSATSVLNEVKSALAGSSNKDETFRNLMYKYNEDGGIMNATYPYVIGEKDGQSEMVESFTEASRELNTAGEYGAVSDLVESEYGVHIIYYMGKCSNTYTIPEGGQISFRENYTLNDGTEAEQHMSDVLKLDETYLNNLNNKTIFDLVYESLANDNYSLYEAMNIDTIKVQNKITVVVADKLI